MILVGRTANRLLKRGLWCLFVALLPLSALAQQPTPGSLPGAEAPPQPESSGDPTFGYFAYGLLAGLIIFLVCKSARRARPEN